MAQNVNLLSIDESGYRYIRESLARLLRENAEQAAAIRELKAASSRTTYNQILIGRANDDIPAAEYPIPGTVTPGEGELELYTVDSGLDSPVSYNVLGGSRATRNVLNFTCVEIWRHTFPVRVSRIDDTGQLGIFEAPHDQYFGKALQDIAQGLTGDFEVDAPDGTVRVIEDVFANRAVFAGEIVPIFLFVPHECKWGTLNDRLSSGVGVLQESLGDGDDLCAAGPATLNVERLDEFGCYQTCRDIDGNPISIQVWNTCAAVDAFERVQFKLEACGGRYLVDVVCCPEDIVPPPPDHPAITKLGLGASPVGYWMG